MASIKADEITKILKAQIANYDQAVAVEEVARVVRFNEVGENREAPMGSIRQPRAEAPAW